MATPTFITERSVLSLTRVHPLFQYYNDFYGASIALLGWFLSRRVSLQRLRPCLCYVSKRNDQLLYHVNGIYSPEGGDTHASLAARTAFFLFKPGARLVS